MYKYSLYCNKWYYFLTITWFETRFEMYERKSGKLRASEGLENT